MTKAIRIFRTGGPEVMEYVDVEVGEPGPGEVRVRVLASGVCHSDLHAIEHGFAARYPLLLGRPYAYGLAAGGQEGVEEVIRQTMAETDLTLALVGAHAATEVDRTWIAG